MGFTSKLYEISKSFHFGSKIKFINIWQEMSTKNNYISIPYLVTSEILNGKNFTYDKAFKENAIRWTNQKHDVKSTILAVFKILNFAERIDL